MHKIIKIMIDKINLIKSDNYTYLNDFLDILIGDNRVQQADDIRKLTTRFYESDTKNNTIEEIKIAGTTAQENINQKSTTLHKKYLTNPCACPYCGANHVVRNGIKNNKQQYLCRNCKGQFVDRTESAISHSHGSEMLWKLVIDDTIEGVALRTTAEKYGIAVTTAFNMRHKILANLEFMQNASPSVLNNICEADETYLLESEKGSKISEDYYRCARKRGEKASKRGLSSEQICIFTAVERNGRAISKAINRARPSKDKILQAFEKHVNTETVLICDGEKNYNVLRENGKCIVAHAERNTINNINTANSFHSHIKERNRNARGFATKYLNRYNALFVNTFRRKADLVNTIYNSMTQRNMAFKSIKQVINENLLVLPIM